MVEICHLLIGVLNEDQSDCVVVHLNGTAGQLVTIAGPARQRHRVAISGIGQVMAVPPHHPHESRAIQTAELAFFGIIGSVARVQPTQTEIVVEIGPLLPGPVRLQRSVGRIAGNLQVAE